MRVHLWSCPLCRGERLPRGIERLSLCGAHFDSFVRSTMLYGRGDTVPPGPLHEGVEISPASPALAASR